MCTLSCCFPYCCGVAQGGEYTQQTYRQQADVFKQHWLLRHPEVHGALQSALKVSNHTESGIEQAAAQKQVAE